MLFNSYVFVLGFLPIAYLVGRLLARRAPLGLYLGWLVVVSVLFYSWQDVRHGLLFVASIGFNSVVATRLVDSGGPHRRAWCAVGVGANLALIGYFKYRGFGATIVNNALGTTWPVPEIVLPLGISFYTLQQIAYLVDAYRGLVPRHDLVRYSLFVAFFPQLIAGPIVRQREVLEQFVTPRARRFSDADFAVGVTYFSLGLFKKVVLADELARFANPVFGEAETGLVLPSSLAWIGVLSYTLQLYFDFSGYSDMALGLGRLFGIKLPLNFDSPYQAVSIADFWRRWHMTLSGFFRDYVYVPLGGSRCAPGRRALNVLVTMLVGGVWHGAGWTFVVFGAVHGVLLIVSHAWDRRAGVTRPPSRLRRTVARGATFLTVALTLVLFRAESLPSAGRLYWALLVPSSAVIDYPMWLAVRDAGYWLPIGLLIVWGLPSSQQFLGRIGPAWDYRFRAVGSAARLGCRADWWQWRPTPWHAVVSATLFVAAFCAFTRTSHFLYFNF